MVDAEWVPLRVAWHEALYGDSGFYRRNQPADHFRTSAHVSPTFADAVVELARRNDVTSICDLGAGSSELLTRVHRQEPTWSLVGVEIRARPAGLSPAIGWQRELPSGYRGLIFANELLDNVPCDVVELDSTGTCRTVEVMPSTGEERLGSPAAPDQMTWLSRWWPLVGEGARAEVGLLREALWVRVCAANPDALCVAVDYGHCVDDRPDGGSLSSYRAGRQAPVSFDGEHDITADVAFDSLVYCTGGRLKRQRDILRELGFSGGRPTLTRAAEDPAGYLRALARATESAELTEAGGLGDFYWLLSPPRSAISPATTTPVSNPG